MLYTSFTLMLLTALFLLFGLIKPKWVLFWMKNPDRIWVLAITVFLVMISFTLFGEANKRLREAQQQPAATTTPAPVPAPATPPAPQTAPAK